MSNLVPDQTLQEMMVYYKERAQEYDEWFYRKGRYDRSPETNKRWFAEVDEAFSTRTCSACRTRSGPQGIAGLGIRAWTCGECGAAHDRDLNAAKNILAAGRRRLAEGIPAL